MNELRKLVFILGLCLLANQGFCQEQFYVFIQSQNHQPFYARTGSTTFQSSGNGYLVIPQLTTGSYEVVIGVPESKPAEWSFHFNVNKEDLGFVLLDKGKNNITLVSLDKKSEIRGVTVKPKEVQKEVSESVTGIVSDDPFSTMLAGAVNDPTIRQKLVIIEKKEPVPVLSEEDKQKRALALVEGANKKEDKSDVTPAPVTEKTEEIPANKKSEERAHTKSKTVASPAAATPSTEVKEPALEEKKAQTTTEEINAEPGPEIKKTVKSQSAPETDREKATKDIPQKQEPVKTVSEEKKTNTVSAKSEVKSNEPFVIKEVIGKADNKESAKPSKKEVKELTKEEVKAETKSEAKAEDDVKYLPFVITPDEKEPAEKKIVPAEPADIKVDEKKADQREDVEITTPVEEKKKRQKDTPKKSLLSSIKKTLERRSRDGTDIIYIDEGTDGEKDTIRIFIPSTK